MSGAVRIGDACSGHDCFPPRPAVQGSSDVFVNGIPSVRVSDRYDFHTCEETHDGRVITGSSTVFVNGLPKARVGDQIDCGSHCMLGSSDVFVG